MTEPRLEERGQEVTLEQDPSLGLSGRAKSEIMFAIMLGLFLGALDQTIVGTALPKIVTELKGNDLYVWVVTIYLLTSTITVPFYGKLSDLYGRKPLLMIGIGLFLVGSALSGLSQNMAELILFRGIQGVGAGALFPISLAVIGDLFTPAERGKYQGLFGAVFGIAFLIGPALGGFLTDHISWHWIFYVNLPIGIISLYVIWRLLPTVKRPDATRNLDILGGIVFTVGTSLLLIGLTNKQSNDWTAPSVGGLLVASAAILAVFLFIETRTPEPIIPLTLFRNRTYTASIVATFLVSFGFFGAIIFLPRWFQFVRGTSATESGYQSLALLFGLIFSSIVSGQIVARTGKYKWLVVASVTTMAVGLLLMTQLRSNQDIPTMWVWMFIAGVGIGPTLAVFTIVVQNAVPFDKLGVATSNLTFFRQIGGSIGLAIVGTLFGTTFKDQLVPQLVNNGIPPQFAGQLSAFASASGQDITGVGVDLKTELASKLPAQAQPFLNGIVQGIHDAFTAATATTFGVGVVTTALAVVVVVFMLKELPLRTTVGPARATQTEPDRVPPRAAAATD
jgi:EmrB/QacA subfamily drug resistance transporter